jgi:PhzF family phenazine biosynthesis protein
MEIPIAQVDAFTDTPFRGNPAGVCVLDTARTAGWMQSVAAEMNVAETAFLEPRADGFGLRWFTPLVEVDLCGHATLASAHLLWETGRLPDAAQARFHTRSGLLTADRRGAWIELDFPATPAAAAEAPPAMAAALGVTPKWIGRSRFDYLVEVDSEETVRAVTPDLKALAAVDTRGVIVTAPSASRGYDFVSRFFAPRAGIDEDPVTGSSHCCLAPYWAARLGKQEMTAYQASARGGVVRVRIDQDRIRLGGQAITVLRGVLIG